MSEKDANDDVENAEAKDVRSDAVESLLGLFGLMAIIAAILYVTNFFGNGERLFKPTHTFASEVYIGDFKGRYVVSEGGKDVERASIPTNCNLAAGTTFKYAFRADSERFASFSFYNAAYLVDQGGELASSNPCEVDRFLIIDGEKALREFVKDVKEVDESLENARKVLL